MKRGEIIDYPLIDKARNKARFANPHPTSHDALTNDDEWTSMQKFAKLTEKIRR